MDWKMIGGIAATLGVWFGAMVVMFIFCINVPRDWQFWQQMTLTISFGVVFWGAIFWLLGKTIDMAT